MPPGLVAVLTMSIWRRGVKGAINYTSRDSAGSCSLEENSYLVSTPPLSMEAFYLYLSSDKWFCHLQPLASWMPTPLKIF